MLQLLPITLLESLARCLFVPVLLTQLQPLLHRTHCPHQSGFTKSWSTLDAILALRLDPFWTPFWVPEAATCSLQRLIKGKGFPPMLLKLIEHLYTGTSARVRLGQKLSHSFMTFPVYAKVASSRPIYFVPLWSTWATNV